MLYIFLMPKEFYPSTIITRNETTCEESPRRQTETKVTLLLRSQSPIDIENLSKQELQKLDSAAVIAAQAARTCYSAKLQTPLDYINKSDKYRDKSNEIAASTIESGHLTTRQHVHYTFALEGISRHAVYFLHGHPHHNSEMMSQRYVNLAETQISIPDMGSDKLNALARNSADNLVAGYNQLYDILTPTTKKFLLERFPGRNTPKWEDQINNEAGKKSQEIARYLLPLGTPSNLYHTISELTLLRLYHQSRTMPAQPELKNIIDSMVAVVAKVDPSILSEISKPLPKSQEFNNFDFGSFTAEFDELINNTSLKIDKGSSELPNHLARAVRLTLGISSQELPDADALDLLLNPAKNSLLTSTLGDVVLDRLGQCLNQIQLSALVTMSHVANEQFHRHRGFNHTEQTILPIPNLEKDIIIPVILESDQKALDLYLSIHAKHIDTLNQMMSEGATLDDLQYLLTNATRVRKSISGPLGAYFHFIKSRTCLTAQEEIYSIAIAMAQQLSENHPELAKYFQKPAPCGVRNAGGIKPNCPEGKRFCGVRVWDLTIDNYPKRTI